MPAALIRQPDDGKGRTGKSQ